MMEPIMLCDFITPGLAALFATMASTATTIVTSSKQADAAKKASRKQQSTADEAARRDQLLVDRTDRLRQRRAAGSGQKTILGGADVAPQGEIGRNVLLGQ